MPLPYSGNHYRIAYRPDHPLAMKSGTVLVHRLVLFDQFENGAPCNWCGRDLDWFKAPLLIGDHLDDDITNNEPSNLVPSCRSCNGNRARAAARHGTISGYQSLKCREPCCTEPWNAYQRDYRARRKASGNPVRNNSVRRRRRAGSPKPPHQ